jgi:hypothetical protein
MEYNPLPQYMETKPLSNKEIAVLIALDPNRKLKMMGLPRKLNGEEDIDPVPGTDKKKEDPQPANS